MYSIRLVVCKNKNIYWNITFLLCMNYYKIIKKIKKLF